ncbi:5,6-dimethylbenzimidazole synthase [Mycobacterium sp. CBMA293]|uniref:5,6-dimethylbenzimidazole synthase n=1 Tax=unclassified Mycolicibacterium TaxID=2636767 RepID=UPI001324D2C8|nr:MULTISPECIES: 5,6-dimethylbenzimidazole synthase [unclassified Mycolicibacterium]MUL44651.1 5,6-dimethylbenzimidazole synthase [Mycolicibacterium sp. CBMA 360]MUL93791.1 5,6-dimethylbenzimidazole synthase [Mycolicibacterium sp. CBMA 230]MUM31163.1 5,6-dimethylbenzimidazole synthase [Mycolicibacterium sp. CBMA 361]MUL59975.1 5,6-dimethylbenzimidazole synthase [Mycolicibacterium sp. CBMA 335]MUL68818.1 5,6-dimethylbenzimidazole synthase [Mycolicibacterium sp. CBMA 311]
MSEPSYSDTERAAVYRVMAERRDMRHFTPNSTVPEDVLRRLLEAAHMAPSVGLMQPWRFLRIIDPLTRTAIKELVDAERVRTGEALGPREAEFLSLKVEGIGDCAELLVVALGEHRERHIFGRRTMPHMDLASVSCAIQNMWLAARAEGLGLGWVSLFEPAELAELLDMPDGADPIAVLCIGPVPEFPDRPELEIVGWKTARPLDELLYTDVWPVTGSD